MLLSVASTVGIVLDVAIVALLLICAFIGLHKGFFKSIISMISTIVVLIVSIYFASPLAKLINKIYDFTGLIAGKLSSSIASMGAFYSEVIPSGVSGADIANNIPSSTNGFLKTLMSYVLKPLTASEIEGATVAEIVSGAFASIIMTIIAGILLFILIKIVLSLASKLFDNITQNKVIGFVNKIFGFIFGFIKGGLIIFVFTVILTLLTVIPLVNTKVSPIIQDHTKIAKPIYNYTDELVEKYVIDGKLIQKWVDSLWENKYNSNEDDNTEVSENGSLENPYTITLIENEGEWIANINIEFSDENLVKYYKLNASTITSSTFNLTINIEGADYSLYTSSNTDEEINSYSNLNKENEYIIKFTRNSTSNSVTAILNITQNAN